eukprot:GHVU01049585.1.p1 GENE.GHVU01049585.1~~GHVU01049585.1.p1  ORF type:complete len:172 (+),score=12.86 GHVU01049585.1:211-726(+)
MGRNTRMQQWINYRVRVTIQDGRMFVGTLSAFDRHMNVVLADCEEFRRKKTKKTTKQLSGSQDDEKEIKRTLGFVLVRGEGVISLTAEAPPPAEARRMGEGPVAGPGRGQVAGRGMQVSSLASAPAGTVNSSVAIVAKFRSCQRRIPLSCDAGMRPRKGARCAGALASAVH